MSNVVEQLDAKIAELLSSWNIYTTVIAIIFAGFIVYPLFFWDEPDTHPLLLARQAQPSPIRHPGESATYRSVEVPHGYPLKTGLNVKDAGAPKWTAGRDGDVRDVWREVIKGLKSSNAASPASSIMTIYGKDALVEHDLVEITKSINVIGTHLQKAGAAKVAIYLPNSVEYLAAIFACAFYGLSPVLIPYNQPHHVAFELLSTAGVDSLIVAAGSLPLVELSQSVPKLRQIVWVVERTSRHMDWTGAPDEADGNLSVFVWHDLVENSQDAESEVLPSNDQDKPPGNVITFWQAKPGDSAQIVEFSQKNIVSAVGALISAIPMRQRLTPSDLVLPADSFSSSYVLCLTLASLFSHASLAINSVAGSGIDLALASRSVSPTVIIASAETLANLHNAEIGEITSGFGKITYLSQTQTMSAGRMPSKNLLSKLLAPQGSSVGNTPGKLRLILASDRAGVDSPVLSSAALSDLRIITHARISYALTAAQVAGAIAQTNVYDYRRDERLGHSHFGSPLSSVEVKLVDEVDQNVDGSTPTGEIVVSGPAVAGGQAKLGVRGRFGEDCTLAYA